MLDMNDLCLFGCEISLWMVNVLISIGEVSMDDVCLCVSGNYIVL